MRSTLIFKIVFSVFLLHQGFIFAQSNFSWQDTRRAIINRELDRWESLQVTLNNLDATIGVQAGYVKGDTTYHISFDNPQDIGGHGESELE